ncbi:MAG: sigma-54 dependent transcriptional regulator [Candidatus Aminicenantes bacterium]|nr:sigma-54 dependent transcriptional regulator [Candidatus Aminicenantes bacterium]
MENVKVLVVDDEKNIQESVKMVLEYEKYSVCLAKDGISGIDSFKKTMPDIVLLDVKMPGGMDGLQVLKSLREVNPDVEVIMISGHSGIEEAVEASRLGAFDFLEKPISRDKLVLTVRNAAEKIQLRKENSSLRTMTARKYELVGRSGLMQALQETIRRVARSDSTVLISGDSGTGKELIARLIHQHSGRRQNRFVQVNCAAIPDELIESELFGHEKGSFTGAYEKKIGKFESAHRGSIFLDEIGDLSLKAQAKVLRILQEKKYERVGGTKLIATDVRVVAATNKDLEKEMEEGRFRQDLYYRLNVIPLRVPPLRDRKEDIPLLVKRFLKDFSSKEGEAEKTITDDALAILMRHSWPGNVRELKNIVERLNIMKVGNVIEADDIPLFMKKEQNPESEVTESAPDSLREAKTAFEKQYIAGKLKEYDGNVSRTAEAIGLERSNLHRKIKAYGLDVKNEEAGDGSEL